MLLSPEAWLTPCWCAEAVTLTATPSYLQGLVHFLYVFHLQLGSKKADRKMDGPGLRMWLCGRVLALHAQGSAFDPQCRENQKYKVHLSSGKVCHATQAQQEGTARCSDCRLLPSLQPGAEPVSCCAGQKPLPCLRPQVGLETRQCGPSSLSGSQPWAPGRTPSGLALCSLRCQGPCRRALPSASLLC